MPMRRADRRDDSYDHSMKHPKSHQPEPSSSHELKQLLMTTRSQRDDAQKKASEQEQRARENHQLYLEQQQKHQTAIALYHQEQQNHQQAKTEVQSYLALYRQEKYNNQTLQVQYETVVTERDHYLTLYQQVETVVTERDHYLTRYQQVEAELKLERRSKAGIKGWETRRKRENEQLKQEIGEMAVLLRDSLARKDEAINNLDAMAERMDRIQHWVDLLDEEQIQEKLPKNPLGLFKKLLRIWWAIKNILAE